MRVSTSDITGKRKGSGSNDIFEKCRNFTRPSDLQAAGLYMYFEVFGDREGCGPGEVRMGRRKVLMFGSNDYLDLITHPKVKEAASPGAQEVRQRLQRLAPAEWHAGPARQTGSELASFVHKEAAIIFGTGFQANYATLSALTEKGDVMVCDHNLHASLVEGALRSPARTVRFRHNDMDHFERCLENCPPEEKIFIVCEGVFSMEGDIADLRGILKLAKPYGARTYVDEAHGIGVLGETGAGAAEHLGVLDDVDIVMGTFSKSLASVGGFIAGERAVIDYLKHTARPFVFSASLPAASVAAVGAALQIMKKEPERRLHLLRIAQTAARRTALARLQRAARRDGDRAGGDSAGARSVPPVQGAARRRHLHQPGAASGGRAESAAHFLHRGAHRKARGAAGEYAGARRGRTGHRTIVQDWGAIRSSAAGKCRSRASLPDYLFPAGGTGSRERMGRTLQNLKLGFSFQQQALQVCGYAMGSIEFQVMARRHEVDGAHLNGAAFDGVSMCFGAGEVACGNGVPQRLQPAGHIALEKVDQFFDDSLAAGPREVAKILGQLPTGISHIRHRIKSCRA